MTGIELFRDEMRRRGCTEAQIKSKGVTTTLDIISNSNMFSDLAETEEQLEKAKRQLAVLENNTRREKERLERIRCNQSEELERVDEYIKNFNESLEKMETPEARDALKTAQLFINTIDVQTDQNNTAFISGLAMILCGVRGGEYPEKLKKASGQKKNKTLGRL